jgi:hypothetical protein
MCIFIFHSKILIHVRIVLQEINFINTLLFYLSINTILKEAK